ncbi:hypothetical protein HDU91_002560, partial [Kappamyces sp. JEL0680]
TNPHRSVGNATEKWLSRLRNIADRINDAEEPQASGDRTPDVIEKGELEFVKEDDEDQGDGQALGVATEAQMDQMDKTALGEPNDEDSQCIEEMEEDEPMHDPSTTNPTVTGEPQEAPEAKQRDRSIKNRLESTEESNADEAERVPQTTDADGDARMEFEEAAVQHVRLDRASEIEVFEAEDESHPLMDYDELRKELEVRMMDWRLGRQETSSRELWRKYSNLTRDLSFHLCEQLRLILEPTLSTKLKGDYKTGKRLNMRKIIPYIASQFKKDKIWLRRTKPSKRTYQVMMAIDDSLSMSNSHSVQLAFESLTLIANALNQLEVGEIGVISFGDDVKLLHPFEGAWSDEAGSSVLSAFTFSQERTRVKLLMEQSLKVLEHSRAMQQSSDLWQLQIVISDGICDDHDYIRSRVRSALEDRVAMVFVVLDTRPEADSIVNMSNVSYDVDPASGAPVLKMTKYMDTFPFDFYVVVKNVEKLPEILSDTLRQFFAFVAQ